MVEEFYPMPMFVKLFVSDVEYSANWYSAALGFRSVFSLPKTSGQLINHLRLERYQDLLLIKSEGDVRQPSNCNSIICFAFSGDMKSLAEQASKLGGRVEGPKLTDWNTREVTVEDPDGFMVTFSEVVDSSRKFDDVMQLVDD